MLERWYDRITADKESVRMHSPDDEERFVAGLWKVVDRDIYQQTQLQPRGIA